jgi:hypothetical protein
MKDLFGAEHPDPPPMDAPLPYVLWRMDLPDHPTSFPEYWLARTKSEAEEAFLSTYEWVNGAPVVEAHEVTAAPAADSPECEVLTDAGAAFTFSNIDWRPSCACFFCGGDD